MLGHNMQKCIHGSLFPLVFGLLLQAISDDSTVFSSDFELEDTHTNAHAQMQQER